MEYWTEDEEELRFEINITKLMITRFEKEIEMCKGLINKHKDRLKYLEGLSSNQTKINFDENDTNQY